MKINLSSHLLKWLNFLSDPFIAAAVKFLVLYHFNPTINLTHLHLTVMHSVTIFFYRKFFWLEAFQDVQTTCFLCQTLTNVRCNLIWCFTMISWVCSILQQNTNITNETIIYFTLSLLCSTTDFTQALIYYFGILSKLLQRGWQPPIYHQ